MKLTLEHIALYLPYQCKLIVIKSIELPYNKEPLQKEGNIIKLCPFSLLIKNWQEHFKPILRPLSDLTREIEHNGVRFVPIEKLEELSSTGNDDDWLNHYFDFIDTLQGVEWSYAPHWMVVKLISWHFDINNLIENNLAIDINSIK